MTPQTKLYDALIIGGGPSGLSAALSFARQTYSTVVFDSQIYRNDNASHMHNMLTWDHCPASEFRATARQNIISRYDTVKFQNSKIVLAAQDKDGNFEVTDENQAKFVGKKLVLATGVTDALPDIKGFDKLWGRAIFPCLFCDGFEDKGAASAGVLTFNLELHSIVHQVQMAGPFVENVTIYCHGDEEITTQVQNVFEGKSVVVEPRKIVALERKDTKIIVHLESGGSREEAFLVCDPPVKINGSFHEQLGLDADPRGFIKTNFPYNETSVSGVFAVGDCGSMLNSVPLAVAMGTLGAAGVVTQLGALGRFSR